MAHLPSKPSALRLQRRTPVALGILIGGVGRVDGVDHGGPGRGQHLHAGEVPEVTGVGHDGVEVAVDPGVQGRREVAGAEDQRFEPIARLRDLERVGQALRLLNEDLQADRPGETELGLELRQQHVDPPHVAGRAHLRHDQHVERVACPGHDLDDVAVAPRRVDPVDADGPHRRAPVLTGQRTHRDGPRSLLRRGGAGVLEVEEDEVGTRRRPPSRTCARCWPGWPARHVGLAVRACCSCPSSMDSDGPGVPQRGACAPASRPSRSP